MRLAGVGVWSGELRRHEDEGERREAAAELEELGYAALWIPGGQGGAIFDAAGALLEATREVSVATGIVNIWRHDPEETAAERAQLDDAYEGRFLLGLGVSHAPLIDEYTKPLTAMRDYLESLDAAAPAVPKDERVLAVSTRNSFARPFRRQQPSAILPGTQKSSKASWRGKVRPAQPVD